MAVIGTCKLCLAKGVQLKDSHLLPANIYRKIRRPEGANNSIVLGSQKSFHFSDKQISDYVLCGECEQKIGEVENFVSRECLQDDGSFPVRDGVVSQTALFDDPELSAFSGKASGIENAPDGLLKKLDRSVSRLVVAEDLLERTLDEYIVEQQGNSPTGAVRKTPSLLFTSRRRSRANGISLAEMAGEENKLCYI